MKTARLVTAVIALGVVAACMFGLAACANNKSGADAVAATVNGTEIKEQKVTDQIEAIRKQSGLDDEEQWGEFLAQNDMTPSSVRDQIIESLEQQELVKQGASELGIKVEDSEIDEYVNQMKSNYANDEAWNKALSQAGFSEDEYREMIKESLYQQKVSEHFEQEAETSDEDLLEAAKTTMVSYDGAKRSSHILFKVDNPDDEAAVAEATQKANDVLAQINAGTLDFAEAAKQYSGDTGSAEQGGDVGWDKLNSFVTEYTNALNGLDVNQVSGPVKSDYGIHIIKCTEIFKAPAEITSLDQIPEAFRDELKEQSAATKSSSAYQEWLDKLKENANIVKNDMPSGLPYDIDVSKYADAVASTSSTASDESSSSTTETPETSESATETSGSSAEASSSGSSAE